MTARRERDALVRRELAALPSDQREAVTLHYLLGAPLADVVAAQGIGVKAAKKRAQRGAERLRTRLARAGVALSLTVFAELRADQFPFDHARSFDALHAAALPAAHLPLVKGAVMVVGAALPVVVAITLAAQGGGQDVRAGDHPPVAVAGGGARTGGTTAVAGRISADAVTATPATLAERIDLVQDAIKAEDVLRTLSAVTRIPIDLAPDLARRSDAVTVRVMNSPVSSALDAVVQRIGARWRVERGRVVVEPAPVGSVVEHAKSDAIVPGPAPVAWPDVSIDLVDVPMGEAMTMLSTIAKRPIRVDGDISTLPNVTLKVERMSLVTTLETISKLTGLSWRIVDGAIVVSPPQQ